MTLAHDQRYAARKILEWGAVLFLLTATLQKRHIFPSPTQFLAEAFTESGALALYVSDIIFGILVIFWFFSCPWRRAFPRTFVFLCAGLGTWALFEAFRSSSIPLGLYHSLRVLQGILLSLIVIDFLHQKIAWRKMTMVIILVGLAQSALGVSQMFARHSLGLSIIGEPVLNLALPGVAKVDTTTGKVLRAYGTFPHANVLGGFLVMVLMILLFTTNPQGENTLPLKFIVIGTLLTFGVLATFSRSAYLSLLVLAMIYLMHIKKNKYGTATLRNIVLLFILPLIIFIAGFYGGLSSRIFPSKTDQFISDRVRTQSIGLSQLKQNFLLGVGGGNYIYKIISTVPEGTRKYFWKFQYPHNLFLTIAVEYGLVGFILFFFLLFYSLFKKKYTFSPLVFEIIIVTLPIILLDHYLWTTQQGRILLWLTIGVLTSMVPATVEQNHANQKVSH